MPKAHLVMATWFFTVVKYWPVWVISIHLSPNWQTIAVTSATLAQHWNNIGSISRVCSDGVYFQSERSMQLYKAKGCYLLTKVSRYYINWNVTVIAETLVTRVELSLYMHVSVDGTIFKMYFYDISRAPSCTVEVPCPICLGLPLGLSYILILLYISFRDVRGACPHFGCSPSRTRCSTARQKAHCCIYGGRRVFWTGASRSLSQTIAEKNRELLQKPSSNNV